jgi:hypothetical protein
MGYLTLSGLYGGGATVPFDISSDSIIAEALIVGGGGGGGSPASTTFTNSGFPAAGSGGAGRVIFLDLLLKIGNSYLVTVGEGGNGGNTTGAATNAPAEDGFLGGNSILGDVIAPGGGGGGGSSNALLSRVSGGSSGGFTTGTTGSSTGTTKFYGALYPSTTSATTGICSKNFKYYDLGNAGGTTFYSGTFGNYSTGGGGGAGGAGGQGTFGPGVNYGITGVVTEYGKGGLPRETTGGGGSGAAGEANTGNGGQGSAGFQNFKYAGGKGGSGIVVIAYPNTYPAITTIPGSLTVSQPTTRSGYRVYVFTAGSGNIII